MLCVGVGDGGVDVPVPVPILGVFVGVALLRRYGRRCNSLGCCYRAWLSSLPLSLPLLLVYEVLQKCLNQFA